MTRKLSYDQYEVIRKLYGRFGNSTFIYKDVKDILSRSIFLKFTNDKILNSRSKEFFKDYRDGSDHNKLVKKDQKLWALNPDYIKVANCTLTSWKPIDDKICEGYIGNICFCTIECEILNEFVNEFQYKLIFKLPGDVDSNQEMFGVNMRDLKELSELKLKVWLDMAGLTIGD